ncbi:MAG: hypothetical protein ACLSTJ_05735 [Clostridium neonatale]
MDRDELIKQSLLFTCFLENITSDKKVKIKVIVDYLNTLSNKKLQEYYDINKEITNKRLERYINNDL